MALMVVACGDDDDASNKPAAQPAQVNQQAAKQNAQSTITALSATVSGTENGASVSALSSAAQSSQSLLQPSSSTGTRAIAQAFGIESSGLHPLDIGDPGCSCTANSCTFTNCSFGSASAGGASSFTIDGTYSWGGGKVTCTDLKYTFKTSGVGLPTGASSGVSGLGTDMVITLDCDITVTDTSINGFVQSKGNSTTSIGQASYSTTWNVKSTYNAVTYDKASKQPTAGSLKVEGSGSTNAGGQAYDYAGSAEVTFP